MYDPRGIPLHKGVQLLWCVKTFMPNCMHIVVVCNNNLHIIDANKVAKIVEFALASKKAA